MPRKRRPARPLATIWEVPDDLWAQIEPILRQDWRPSPKGGRPPKDWRPILNGIIHRLRSGCQWNRLPKDFGDDSTLHRWFQRWCRHGVLQKVWAGLVESCAELGAVHWDWQSADGRLGKARFGGGRVGPNPTDRAKSGTKQSVLVDRDGGPLGAVVVGANVNDHLALRATIEAIVVERPEPTEQAPQHLCLDAAYDNAPSRAVLEEEGYTPHIRPSKEAGQPSRKRRGAKARRWVVERTLAWLSKCRALLVRYDKHWQNYLGLLQLACALLWYRRLHRLRAPEVLR
jgi:putative transposase